MSTFILEDLEKAKKALGAAGPIPCGIICSAAVENALRNDPAFQATLAHPFYTLPVVIDAEMSSEEAHVYHDQKAFNERVKSIQLRDAMRRAELKAINDSNS